MCLDTSQIGCGGTMATVLLVEDDDQVRVLSESCLEQQGHQVLSAGTEKGAIAFLKREGDGWSGA